jgi:HEAT repeat protein
MGKTDLVVSALKDKDSDVRVNAIRGLKSVGKPAIGPLILALKDNDEQTKKTISSILIEMTFQLYGQDYEKWKKWWERNKNSYR